MVLSVIPARAQKEGNNWFFGYGASITFNTSPPSILDNSNLFNKEGCSSVSDSLGNLLFYTNGLKVWTKKNEVMKNGDNLKGNASSTHSALIVPRPNSTLYYVFTLGEINFPNNNVYYSIVDISKNGGLGEVISKNNFLFIKSMEKIAAVQHKNAKDFWIIAPQNGTDLILVYKLTEQGLSKTPQKYSTGVGRMEGVGQIKFAFDGKTLAFIGTRPFLMDFDITTGKVSNGRKISFLQNTYGLEFSSNNDYLYFATHNRIYQCAVEKLKKDPTDTTLCKFIKQPSLTSPGQMQMAPNRKIYLSMWQKESLAVINHPDSSINKCGFETEGLLLGGKKGALGLPSFPVRNTHFLNPEIYISNTCLGDTSIIELRHLNADSAKVNFGDGNEKNVVGTQTKHYYNVGGSYTIKAITFKNGKEDSIVKNISVKELPVLNLGKDTLLCLGSSISYNLSHPSVESYRWSTGNSTPTQNITQQGVYWAEISNSECISRDSITVEYISGCQLTAANFCYGDDTKLSIANSNADSITWDFGDGAQISSTNDTIIYKYQDSGTFTVNAQQYLNGLSTTTTKQITITRVDKPNLGSDTIICEGKNLQINYLPNFDSYTWNDGTNTPVKAITKQGLYWMEVEKNNCSARDSIEVTFFDCEITTANKCLGESTIITTKGNNTDSIQWDFGDNTTQTTTANQIKYKYNQEGDYTITTNIFIQEKQLEIKTPISIIKLPESNLPSDTLLCENQTINSGINDPATTLQWSDGSSLPYLLPKESKTYTLTIKQGECENNDTIKVTIQDCGCELYFPNAYTPDNNNLNEQFAPTTECPLKKYKLQIYNRWGALIFESKQPERGWDGNYKNQPAPIGTYMWVVSYQSKYTGKIYNQKGSISLLR